MWSGVLKLGRVVCAHIRDERNEKQFWRRKNTLQKIERNLNTNIFHRLHKNDRHDRESRGSSRGNELRAFFSTRRAEKMITKLYNSTEREGAH